MILTTLFTALALAQSSAQTPAAPAQEGAAAVQGPENGWKDVDGVLLVINDDLLTRGRLLQTFLQRKQEANERTEEGQKRIWNEIYNATIRARVEVQAGEAMGFDKAQIDRFARDDFERYTKHMGGVVGLGKELEKIGLTAEEFREQRRNSIYSELWEDSVTGRGASTAARASRDRFVRPGLIQFEYGLTLEIPSWLPTIGGSEGELRVQQLVLDAAAFETLERAHDLAVQLRRRIVDGEDMGAVVRQYSISGQNDGVVVGVSPSSFARVYPSAAGFVATAKNGDTSDPILVESGKDRGYLILRVLDRKGAEVPSLESPAVQQRLVERLQKKLDDYRIELALSRALANSYIWRAEPPKTH
ncbi:MAG: hypothetical protein HZA53_06420 [Planctomycetes bacterium]|nr:hypothetical protein [Planctomycetota bacterium]